MEAGEVEEVSARGEAKTGGERPKVKNGSTMLEK
jgi:hypothetical protein